MSLFANCREKYLKDAYPLGTINRKSSEINEKELNPYWEGNLYGQDKDFLNGYDYAAYQNINDFFGNLDIYYEKFLAIFTSRELNSIDMDSVNKAEELTENDMSDLNASTLLFIILKRAILEYQEMRRNELITSMIENQEKG